MSETEITEARGRAEARMGLEAPDSLIEEAVKLTEQKIRVKGLPEDYAPLLLEDEIMEACFRAAINGRCKECARSA